MNSNPLNHGPTRFKTYIRTHNNVLEQFKDRDFVGPENLEIVPSKNFFFMRGEIGCLGGIVIRVEKQLKILSGFGKDAMVQTSWYSYNASIRNGHNILRYDNQHEDASFRQHPDPHHKHIFNWVTGDETQVIWIGLEKWPTLGQVIEELHDWYWEHKIQLTEPTEYPDIGLR